MSSRSRVVVAGSTMSAMRAVGVQNCSWNTMVSGLRQASMQAVEVLVVVERIAARPVDQPDVGIGELAAVVAIPCRRDCSSMSVMRATGMKSLTGVGALRQGRAGILADARCPSG